MRLIVIVVVAGTLLFMAPILCYAQGGNQARQHLIKGMALEEEANSAKESRNNAVALKKYQEALAEYEQIKAEFPQWQAMSLVDVHMAASKQSISALKYGSVATAQADIDATIEQKRTATAEQAMGIEPTPPPPPDEIVQRDLVPTDIPQVEIEEPAGEEDGTKVIRLRDDKRSKRRRTESTSSRSPSERSRKKGPTQKRKINVRGFKVK